MKISDGALEVSVAPFGEPGEFEVRVPKALGDEMRQDLVGAGFEPRLKAEFALDTETIVFLVMVAGGTAAAAKTLLQGLAPVLRDFWHRHDRKEFSITGLPDPKTGMPVERKYKGYSEKFVEGMESTLREEVEYDLEAQRRLGMV